MFALHDALGDFFTFVTLFGSSCDRCGIPNLKVRADFHKGRITNFKNITSDV